MQRFAGLLRVIGPLVGYAFVWAFFAMLASNFTDWSNQRLILAQTVVVGTAAIGVTLIIISGGIDLSIGSMIALGTMTTALALQQTGSPVVALLAGVLTGSVVGLAIGAMVIGYVGVVAGVCIGFAVLIRGWEAMGPLAAVSLAAVVGGGLAWGGWLLRERLQLSPFIVTLGMWGGLRGLAEWVGNGQPIYADSSWLNDLMRPGQTGLAAMVNPGVWITAALALLMIAVMRYTRFGRHIFAVGSNAQTARLCGIHVQRTLLLTYVVGVTFVGIAGVLQFADLGGMGDPTTAPGYELLVIASVVIGGASLAGGEGSILGSVIGALIIATVANGCVKLELDNAIQQIVTGGIIVAAVTLDRLRHARAG